MSTVQFQPPSPGLQLGQELPQLASSAADLRLVHGPPAAEEVHRALASAGKRLVDVVGAGLAAVMLGPLMLVVAALIRLDSRGPALFRQPRLGLGSRPFTVWKFRTMAVDAEARLKELEALNESKGGGIFKIKRDPRVTRLGSVLRRTSLDELPQLFNVLRGEMSLVGPRPLPFRDCDAIRATDGDALARRQRVRPGLTGLWQISGRSDLGHEQMLRLDLDYIDGWSMSKDLAIILKTARIVLTCKGAC